MKQKPRRIKTAKLKSDELVARVAKEPSTVLGFDIEKPEQLFDLAADTPNMKGFLQLCTSALFPQLTSDAPGWAKCAAKKAFAPLIRLEPKRSVSEEYENGFLFGQLIAGAQLSDAYSPQMSPLLDSFKRISEALGEQAVKASPIRAADYFVGLRDGQAEINKLPARASQLAQRQKVYLLIAAAWQAIAPGQLNSSAELHKWLLDRNVIVSRTDARETREVCRIIGLRYPNSGGRPRKKN